ncbi:MAG: hypothetical protein JWP16_593 [Alphaproteobacteria bacterium]|nr:hypothetical protein [Alphaproteobacteria bacterium]
MAAKKTSGKKKAATYSIGEWYGNLFRNLGGADQKKYAAHGGKSTKVEICRFRAENPELAPAKTSMCTKKGGVCSIRRFEDAEEEKYGPLVATCPSRFYEDGLVIKAVAKEILGTDDALVVKEVPFLRRTEASEDKTVQAEDAEKEQSQDPADSEREDVGRIDMVLVHPDDPAKWCALEIQAVYFSGDEMGPEFKNILEYSGQGVPQPVGKRRPDFRSSGPKRLMPQLQTKVPTLRRWGKKMAVVIDKPFFEALGPMGDSVPHVSNCDIVWVVVDYEELPAAPQAKLRIHKLVRTTLERSVEGLTAGYPVSLSEFEGKIAEKLTATPVKGSA